MELLNNPCFSQAGTEGELAADWALWSPCEALRPVAQRVDGGIRVASTGSPGMWGALRQTVKGIRPGAAYGLQIRFASEAHAACLHDSVDVVLQWRDAGGHVLQTDFGWRVQPGPDGGSHKRDMTATAPEWRHACKGGPVGAPKRAPPDCTRVTPHWGHVNGLTPNRATSGVPQPAAAAVAA